MKESPSAPRRWWHKLLRLRTQPPAARARRLHPTPATRPPRSGIEPLEGRIAPAALLPGGFGFTFFDADGDHVLLHFSKPIFGADTGDLLAADFNSAFTFSTGDIHSDSSVLQQLQTIDLSHATTASGVSLSITVTSKVGNGQVDVGAIEAFGTGLGKVTIQGDLGQIDCGGATAGVALASLSVKSLGVRTDTQAGTASYTSLIAGKLGAFHAQTVVGAYLDVTGDIDSVTITKSLAARSTDASAKNDAQIQTLGRIGSLIIGSANHATDDALIGGLAANSAVVPAGGAIGSIQITGNLHGGAGALSGSITASQSIGSVVVHGSLIGAAGDSSALIRTSKNIGSATLGAGSGSAVHGGGGEQSGSLVADGALGPVRILGNIQGGEGTESGRVSAGTSMGSVFLEGSLLGVSGTTDDPTAIAYNGSIESSGPMGAVHITGNLVGGDGDNSGYLGATSIPSVRIDGQIAGGMGATSGAVELFYGSNDNSNSRTDVSPGGGLGLLQVGHGLIGGMGDHSGSVIVAAHLGTATLGRTTGLSLTGGAGDYSGLLSAGSITAISLGGILGGAGLESGGLAADGLLGLAQIGGSITGTAVGYHNGYVDAGSLGSLTLSGDLLGGADHSGLIGSAGAIGSVSIGGKVQGGAGDFSGVIESAYGGFGRLGSVTIGHGLLGGAGPNSGQISAGGNLGQVRIAGPAAGALAGAGGDYSGAIYAAGTIASVTVQGAVIGGAGAHSGTIEGHGQVSAVSVRGLQGGSGDSSGLIVSDDDTTQGDFQAGRLGLVHAGQIVGGAGAGSGSVRAEGSLGQLFASALLRGTSEDGGTVQAGFGLAGAGTAGVISIGHLGLAAGSQAGGVVSINGAIGQVTATEIFQGAIHAGTIGTLTAGSLESSVVTALGQSEATPGRDLAIAQVIVSGNVSHSAILAGYDLGATAASTAATDGHAQIGTVSVGGNWIASNLVAGVSDPNHDGFGNSDDVALVSQTGPIVSTIAKITIQGTVAGDGTSQSYGFEAATLGTFSAHGVALPLKAATPAQSFPEGTGVTVREVPQAISVIIAD